MKKYNTRPVGFAGCHPAIAEALKRGEEIKCLVWDNNDVKKEVWICRYKCRSDSPYLSETGVFWKHAEPILRKVKRLMPPERAIPVLIAEGWKFSPSGKMHGPAQAILSTMFCRMGSRLDDPGTISWSWPPCIIEEVEDDE